MLKSLFKQTKLKGFTPEVIFKSADARDFLKPRSQMSDF